MDQAEAATARRAWEMFRHRRDADLGKAHGWLTLTGFHWLPDSPAVVGSLPGLWCAAGDHAVLAARPGDGLAFVETGAPVDGRFTACLDDEESLLWVRFGGTDGHRVVVELARRGGRYAVRPRDAESPVAVSFRGVPVYAYAPEWVLPGRFEPYPRPVDVAIGTAHPQVPGIQRSVGEVVFSLPGDTGELRLQVGAAGADQLTLTFYDRTNGGAAAGWRSLTFAAPAGNTPAGRHASADGTWAAGAVVLDFNRAVNFPSAFTEFGTCPMPVEGNRIPVPVEAGEKRPDAG